MKKFFHLVPILTIITALSYSNTSYSQYSTIADVDRTRPEIDRALAIRPVITSFLVIPGIGANEIHWTASMEKEVRKYILEDSYNGVDFQTAGEMMASSQPYMIKHIFTDHPPLLYRLRTEQFDGKYFYSNIIPSGNIAGISNVEMYPTIVTTNTITVNAFLPVERINILSTMGTQVFAKDIGGRSGTLSMVIPSLSSGTYYIVFYGNNWKDTKKFMIQ
jgi:hypothetical protein